MIYILAHSLQAGSGGAYTLARHHFGSPGVGNMGWLGRPIVFQKILPATRNCLTQTVTSGGNTFSITIFGVWEVSWCGNITCSFSTCGAGRPRRRKEERRGGEAGAATGLSQPTEVSQPSMLCDSSKAPPLGDVIGRIFSLMPCWGPAGRGSP